MATQPEVRQVVQLHAVLRTHGRGGGGIGGRRGRRFGLFRGLRRFSLRRSFSRLRLHGGRRVTGGLRFGFGLKESEPQHGGGDEQEHKEDDPSAPAEFPGLKGGHFQDQDGDHGQDDHVEQGDQSVPVGRIVRLHLHGSAVGLGVEDVVAGLAHGDAGGIAGGIDGSAHQAQHHVVAGAHGQVGIHPGGVCHGGVGDHHADEAPLAPQHVGDQGPGSAGPGGAQIAVAGHDRRGFAFLHGDLKGLQVHLAHGLLIGPNREAQAVGLLIVQGIVLSVHVHALGSRAPDLGRAQLAGEEAVLGIILEVPAGEWGAVDIHAGRIQAHHAVGDGFRAEDPAELLDQVHVPRGADHGFAGEGHAAQGADQGVDACRAVQVGSGGLAHALDRGGGPAAVEDHFGHVVVGQLLKEQVPLGIVPGKARHVGERQAVVLIDDVRIGSVHRVGRFIRESVHHLRRSFPAVRPALGEGAFPVGTGDIYGDLAVFHIRKAGDSRRSVGGAGVALAVVHGLRDGVLPHVDHVMGVVHQLDLIGAFLEHIAARAPAVEGGHVLLPEGNGQGLAFAGIKQPGLGEARQHHMGFLDAAPGIRGGVVHLSHILAGHGAGIGDLHLHDDVPAAVRKALYGLFKGRVAQAVAERILHRGSIIDEPVGSGRFIIAVAHVDALGVFHIIALQVAVGEAARVVIGGSGRQVVSVDIGEAAGGVHIAGEHPAHRVKAHRAGAADPQAGVHALHEPELHRVGGVDEDDHLLIVLAFDDPDQGFLVLGQLQVVPPVVRLAVAGGVHIHGQVAALAADPGKDDDRRVGKGAHGLKEAVGVLVRGDFRRGEVGAGVAALLGPGNAGILIEGHQLVVHLEPGGRQALHHVHVGGGVAAARARAAVDRVDRGVAEQVDLRARRQRQRAVLVAQEHDALFLQPLRHGEALFGRFGRAEDLGALRRLFAGDERIHVRAHEGCDHRFERAAGDIQRQRRSKKRRDRDDPAPDALFHRHALLKNTDGDRIAGSG